METYMDLEEFVIETINNPKTILGHSNSIITTVDKPKPNVRIDNPCWSHLWYAQGINNLVVLVPKHRCNKEMLNWIVNSPQYGECFITKDYDDAVANGLWMDVSKPWHLLWPSLIAVRCLFEFNDRFEFVEKLEHDKINLAIAYYFGLFYKTNDKEIVKYYDNTNHYPIMDDKTDLTTFLEVNITPRNNLYYPATHSIADARKEYGHNIALSMFKNKDGSLLKRYDAWGNERGKDHTKFRSMVKKVGINQTLINFTNDKELW